MVILVAHMKRRNIIYKEKYFLYFTLKYILKLKREKKGMKGGKKDSRRWFLSSLNAVELASFQS